MRFLYRPRRLGLELLCETGHLVAVEIIEAAVLSSIKARRETRRNLFNWPRGTSIMLDVIVLAIGLVFFALSIGYAYACDWL